MEGDLEGAYTMNAFADHFLEDLFAAGHLRTPRRLNHSSIDITADLCTKYMHDEDNAIGIVVENPAGESWIAYGDKRALDSVDTDNKDRCVDAVQASADEIYAAYKTKQAPLPANYQAWIHTPTLESARSNQTTQWSFTNNWWYWTTVLACQTSGLWNYPMFIGGGV